MTSARLAALVVDELIALGVRDAVLCPGSRNAPLSYALHRAEGADRLRLHVRVDERGAGFLALGLAAAGGRPVPVACTSGTAAANLHPAVLEASHRGFPLLTLTADRPPELTGSGANQTTDQQRLYGTATRWFVGLDSAVPEAARSVVARAVSWATGAFSADPGPVQLNLAFREPLVAAAEDVPAVAPMRFPSPEQPPRPDQHGDVLPRTVLVAGDGAAPLAEGVRTAAVRHGWPILAEASAGLGAAALPSGAVLLRDADWLAEHRPERVIVIGAPTLHRSVSQLLRAAAEVVVVSDGPRWADAVGVARRVVRSNWLAGGTGRGDAQWLPAWTDAAAAVAMRVGAVVDGSWPSGLTVARTVFAALPADAAVQLGSSNPVRDVDLAAAPRDGVLAIANRGLAGIDGTLSSAVGLALGQSRPSYALVGDLTFLHDITALLIGPDEPRPDLTVVVVNDDGGGIFSTLEQGAPEHAASFQRLFGTATGADLAAFCAGAGVPHHMIEDRDELAGRVSEKPSGLQVLEVRCRRDMLRNLHAQL